mmetsp:Transcript_3006/g.5040  ORF Transcript_3006/g.5040 Transcript_3006/m.5040 type:complete len:414 (-) Transcript_3006:110-1351(-)
MFTVFVLLCAPLTGAEDTCLPDDVYGTCGSLNLIQRQGQYRLKTPLTKVQTNFHAPGETSENFRASMQSHGYSLMDKEARTDSDGDAYDTRTGLIGCVLAFITYGFFLACPKLVKPTTSGVVYQFYVGLGLIVSTLIALPILGESLVLTWCSLLSGLILVCCLVCTLASIWTIGLTWFSQIQPPLAAIVGFCFCHFILKVAAKNMIVACVGLLLICIGIVCANNLIYYRNVEAKSEVKSSPQADASPNLGFGVILALAAGVLGGLIFAPSHFVAAQYANASFCLGISSTFAVLCACAVVVCAIKDQLTKPSGTEAPKMLVSGRFDVAESLPIGLLQGVLLGLCNIFTLYGCFSPVGVGVTTAVRNSAGCATVLWGAFVFKEYGDLDCLFSTKLLLAVVLVIPGVVLLLAFGIS